MNYLVTNQARNPPQKGNRERKKINVTKMMNFVKF